MRLLILITAYSCLTLLAGCNREAAPIASREPGNNQDIGKFARPALEQLSQSEALARRNRVSRLTYDLNIDLVSLPDSYQGAATLRFDLSDNDTPLDIDFSGGNVSGISANGRNIDVNYNGYYILIPADALAVGGNELSISYSHPYDQNGTGLHRFVDPEDGKTYLYSNFWPYYANRVFPGFDQPNLKARYRLSVRAPGDWTVVSATPEVEVTTEGADRIWQFSQSEILPTYVFSLHAGPYHIWQDMAGEIPIRLLARESLSSYVPAEQWLATTKAGIEHYENYFEIPFPFEKYDQLIVPEHPFGAMENVAAVTFTERLIDRGSSNRLRDQNRAETILHEMAHMWFGDLVTFDWWNGFWLNESFATLMASIAVSEVAGFSDLWHDFYLSKNLNAITADKSVSTHPIEVPVPSNADVFNVFDDISYDKGASVLNQLSHFVGEEDFRLGVSNYLKSHAWENTGLADLVSALSLQSGIELQPWAEDWLSRAGVNTLEARFGCEADSISAFTVLQSADEAYPTLRDQRILLGLFARDQQGRLQNYASLPVRISGMETQVSSAIGLDCPDLAIPNYQAWGYAEVTLDNLSLDSVTNNELLTDIGDPLLRSMIWTALFDASANRQMENARLLGMLIQDLPQEDNDRILRQLLSELVTNLDRLERLGAGFEEELTTYGLSAEQQLWELISSGSVPGGRSQSTLNLMLQSYIDLARSDSALANLAGLMQGDLQAGGVNPGQNLRWAIIRRLAGRGHSEARQLLAAEQLADSSGSGRLSAIAVEAAFPDAATKQLWLDRIREEADPLPAAQLRAAMGALFPPGQEPLQLALLQQLTQGLSELVASRDDFYLRTYGSALFAGICSDQGLQAISAAITALDGSGPALLRALRENAQHAEECLALK
ncbi:MAG: aminopeptidase N [Pseudomonadales bacterium]|nr:aminopeptidase N [Pseudomonadales bacterium]